MTTSDEAVSFDSTGIPAAVLRRGLGALRDIDAFLRITLLFYTVSLPLLGVAAAGVPATPRQIAGLVTVAFGFHTFAYVLNDVIDLPIDRAHPWRGHDPLVRGAVRPAQGLMVALGAGLLTLPVTLAIGGGVIALGALLAAHACLTIYDVYGKRSVWPPLTDGVQGLGWGLLLLHGAIVVGGWPNTVVWLATGHTVLFILAMNGVHAALRDLEYDRRRGARTTAIVLGAHRTADGHLILARPIRLFALLTTLLVASTATVPLVLDAFGYHAATRNTLLLIVAGLDLGSVSLLFAVLRQRGRAWHRSARMHILFLYALLPAVLAPRFSAVAVATLAGVCALSLVAALASDMWFRHSPNAPRGGGP